MVLLMILDRRYGYKVVEISNQGHTFVTVSSHAIDMKQVHVRLKTVILTSSTCTAILLGTWRTL